jgi:signal transduction histidine kinase
VTDLLLAGAIAAVDLIGLALDRHIGSGRLLFCALLCAPLVMRSIDRVACFWLLVVVALGQPLLSSLQVADAAPLVVVFWLGIDGSASELTIGAGAVVIGVTIGALHWSPGDPEKAVAGMLGLVAAAVAVGFAVRERRALVAEMQLRAEHLAAQRDQERLLAATAERQRIAGEAHDVVAHSLTAMIGLADGASYAVFSSPDGARSAVETLSATGRETLAEMRCLIKVLEETTPGRHHPGHRETRAAWTQGPAP